MDKDLVNPGNDELIKQLNALLNGGQAHATFEDAVRDFPEEHRGTVPDSLPYSAWQLVEHIRIAQRDILEFSAPPTGGYQPKAWPEDYWQNPRSHLQRTRGMLPLRLFIGIARHSKPCFRRREQIFTSHSAGEKGKIFCAKPSSSPIMRPIMWAN